MSLNFVKNMTNKQNKKWVREMSYETDEICIRSVARVGVIVVERVSISMCIVPFYRRVKRTLHEHQYFINIDTFCRNLHQTFSKMH